MSIVYSERIGGKSGELYGDDGWYYIKHIPNYYDLLFNYWLFSVNNKCVD